MNKKNIDINKKTSSLMINTSNNNDDKDSNQNENKNIIKKI
ncbi:MAG: hypothetical protein KatS3mg068_0776 [Candidatus Sericytochromatia bacterium]|nr:MAG: hypothetical protein KatS3mg068_0776 [Candidatus Sericytochromatia bacterium]